MIYFCPIHGEWFEYLSDSNLRNNGYGFKMCALVQQIKRSPIYAKVLVVSISNINTLLTKARKTGIPVIYSLTHT